MGRGGRRCTSVLVRGVGRSADETGQATPPLDAGTELDETLQRGPYPPQMKCIAPREIDAIEVAQSIVVPCAMRGLEDLRATVRDAPVWDRQARDGCIRNRTFYSRSRIHDLPLDFALGSDAKIGMRDGMTSDSEAAAYE